MYAADIRSMTDEQILDAIEDQKEAMFNLRFQASSGQLEDPNTLRRTRRDLARLKTVLHERHLATQAVKKEGE